MSEDRDWEEVIGEIITDLQNEIEYLNNMELFCLIFGMLFLIGIASVVYKLWTLALI